MKLTFLSILAFAAIIVAPSCSKKDNGPSNSAQVMFVHGSAAGATTINLDAKLSNTNNPVATNIQFLRNSGYQTVTAGTGLTLSFFVTGLNQLASQTVNLNANTHYTAFASGSITAPGIVFTADDLTAPAAGKAKVRFANLSPDGLNAVCYVSGLTVDSNVASRTCTPFTEVAASSTTVVSMSDHSHIGLINNQQLIAGKIYTFMLTGTSTGTGTSEITLTAITNN
jgi:hypothetical protein